MKIVMCASEVVPFAKTGGLADVVSALPQALERLGHQVIIVMPGYKSAHSVKSRVIGTNVQVYFIEHQGYFQRDGLYGNVNGDYPDNLERFSYFCGQTLELLKQINFKPDIIHCHDWQSALIPVYLKTRYKKDTFYSKTHTLFTLHNLGYQGIFAKQEFPKLGLDSEFFNINGLEFYGQINLLKAGLLFADILNTVSPTYSKEIQTKEFGFGLEGVLNQRKNFLYGILNGLDYSVWDPANDEYIARKFSNLNIEYKAVNKKDLQQTCNFAQDKDIPICGIVSRLAQQKGMDLIFSKIDDLAGLGIQLVILGTGDSKYHKMLEPICKKYPDLVHWDNAFNESLAHKIYAGADIFLMPSQYEPCGLGQMISLKYGTLPLVFKTGGLADTVNKDNGFVFTKYNPEYFFKAVKSAIKSFKDRRLWAGLMKNAMQRDFSWAASAKKYVQLYEKASS